MAIHHIDTPDNLTIQYNGGRVRLCWDGGFSERRSNMFNRKQMIVDSEALRYCSPLIPFRTGALTRSGTIGTVIGSGLLQYSTVPLNQGHMTHAGAQGGSRE